MIKSVYNGFWCPGRTGFTGSSFVKDYNIQDSKTLFTIPGWFTFWKHRKFGLQRHVHKDKPYNLNLLVQMLQKYDLRLVFFNDTGETTRDVLYLLNNVEGINRPKILKGFLEKNQPNDNETRIETFENADSVYIGDAKDANLLYSKGIYFPEPSSPEHSVCSIGFSKQDNKWYGWSHRAIYGFTIGSECKKGDYHYVADTYDGLIAEAIDFWTEPNRVDIRASEIKKSDNGKEYVTITWSYDKLTENALTSVDHSLSKPGKGEWVAKTMDDAKQMAIDFSYGVS